MSKTDWAFLALNTLLLLWAFVGFASTDLDTLLVGAMLAMAVATANGIRIVRNRQTREPRRTRPTRRRHEEDEMDARTILDIDERLEALERREREVEEAMRIRQMVEAGQQSAPAEAESDLLVTAAQRARS